MGLSSDGEAIALAAILSGRYVSAHTGDPGNNGANEVGATGSYARVAAGTFTATPGNPTSAVNDGVIEFPIATGAWGTITHFGFWSAASGGTFLGGEALAVSKAITIDDVLRFLAGQLEVTAD